MRPAHKELIHDYLNIDKKIKRIEKRIVNLRKGFYAQNFTGKMEFSPLGIHFREFKLESKVSQYLDRVNACERNIEKNKRRKQHFKRYTDTLDPHTYSSLKRRYERFTYYEDIQEIGHDNKVLDEILEIEQAISYEFNTPLYEESDLNISSSSRRFTRNKKLEKTMGSIAEIIGI